MKRIARFAVGILLLIGVAAGSRQAGIRLGNAESHPSSIQLSAVNIDVGARPNGLCIEIHKEQRELVLYEDGEEIHSYRIGLGFDPTGDKEREGDGKTPEGDYYICSKNPNSSFYLSLGLSYPNKQDAARGLQARLINQTQYDAIIYAIEHKRQPPWDTPLGGEVFIHGRGSKTDWTLGCIALDDEDIEELFKTVPVGITVVIYP